MDSEKCILVLHKGKGHIIERCLQFRDYEFVFISTVPLVLHDNLKDFQLVSSLSDETEVLQAAAQLMNQYRITHVVPTTESVVLTAGIIRDIYQLHGPGFHISLMFTNKLVMKRKLNSAVLTPKVWLLREFINQIGENACNEKFIIKSIAGSSSVGVKAVSGREIVSGNHKNTEAKIIEEAVQVKNEYHCDVLVRGRRIIFYAVSRYLRPVLSAVGDYHGAVHLSMDNPAIIPIRRIVENMIRHSGIEDAVFHIEIMETEDTLLFGEAAIRPGGGGVADSIHFTFNVDLWDEHFRLLLGLPPGTQEHVPADNSPYVYGFCGLPAREGRITNMISRENLLAFSEIYAVQQKYSPGQIVKRKIASVHFAYIIYFKCSSEHRVYELIDEVMEKYYIVTDSFDKQEVDAF